MKVSADGVRSGAGHPAQAIEMCISNCVYLYELGSCASAVSEGNTGSILKSGILRQDYTADRLGMIWDCVESRTTP